MVSEDTVGRAGSLVACMCDESPDGSGGLLGS